MERKMRLLKSLVLLLLLVSNPVSAQITKLIVDDSTMAAKDIKEVFINNTGGLVINSVLGDFEVEEVDAPNEGPTEGSLISNFTWQNGETDTLLQLGETAVLEWTTADADGCMASTAVADSLEDWKDDTAITTEGPHSVTFNDAGDYVLLLDCIPKDPAGNRDTDAVSVTVVQASIIKFTVTPDSEVVKGEEVSLTFDWETEHTESCHGDWPGSANLALTGTQKISATLNTSTEYKLTCTGPGGYVVNDIDEVVVPIPTTQLACNDNVTLSGNEVSWNSFFMVNWPGPKTQKKRVQIPVGGYLAIKFSTRSVKDVGKLSSIEAAGTHGYRLGSVSRCAGDFKVEEVCKWAWGTWGGITWDTSGEANTGNCNLDLGEDYYWNMTFTDGIDPNTSRCIGTYCETWVIPVNNDYVAP